PASGSWCTLHHARPELSIFRRITTMNETTAKTGYRGKKFTIPKFSKRGGVYFDAHPENNDVPVPTDSPVIRALNKNFDLQEFKIARAPISLGILPIAERRILMHDQGAP